PFFEIVLVGVVVVRALFLLGIALPWLMRLSMGTPIGALAASGRDWFLLHAAPPFKASAIRRIGSLPLNVQKPSPGERGTKARRCPGKTGGGSHARRQGHSARR